MSGAFEFRKAVGGLASVLARTRDRERADFVASMLRGLEKTDVPVLVLSSDEDLTAREFDDLCDRETAWRRAMRRTNVSRVRLKGADHTFSDRRVLEHASTECIAWLDRAVPAETPDDRYVWRPSQA